MAVAIKEVYGAGLAASPARAVEGPYLQPHPLIIKLIGAFRDESTLNPALADPLCPAYHFHTNLAGVLRIQGIQFLF